MIENPYRIMSRSGGATGAVVFVHGFGGDAVATWSGFPQRLRLDPALTGYDFLFWAYPSALNLRYAVTRYVVAV